MLGIFACWPPQFVSSTTDGLQHQLDHASNSGTVHPEVSRNGNKSHAVLDLEVGEPGQQAPLVCSPLQLSYSLNLSFFGEESSGDIGHVPRLCHSAVHIFKLSFPEPS